MTTSSEDALAEGLKDLSGFERGHSSFMFDDNGEVVYIGTEATVKMDKGENVAGFMARLRERHGLRKGDMVQFINNGRGELDTARIIKKSAA